MKMQNIVDCHVHSSYSGDCTIPVASQIEQAIAIGLAGVTFTDHYDIDYPNQQYKFEFDVAARRAFIHDLQDKYQEKIDVYHGIEIGIQPHVIEQSMAIIKHGSFDCVICSTHAVDNFSLCSQTDFYGGKTKEQAYSRYLNAIYESICNFSDYDIVGHIGYIRRYGPYEDNSMPYGMYSDMFDMILKKIIEDGKGIEINTSGYAYSLGSPIPDADVLMRYKQLGGEIITIGSDAHKIERVGDCFDRAIKILRHSGFNYVAHFKNRKPCFNALSL